MLSTAKRFSEFLLKSKATSISNVGSMSSRTSNVEEHKVQVDGVNINYAKTGSGDHPVLLLPGALGSIWTHFKPQVEKLDKNKFTVIAWDPPGYGKSRPSNRTYPVDFFGKDASWACSLMKTLDYDKFSLIGWSGGGVTSLILAAQYPEHVRKMVVFGSNAYMTSYEIDIYENMRDINTWSERMRAPMIEVYGEEYFRKTCSDWIDGMKNIYTKTGGDICKAYLRKIKCPTLIVHGQKDAMISPEHPDYLKANIKNSRVEIFTAGAHNLHLRYPDEFNALVEKFLVE